MSDSVDQRKALRTWCLSLASVTLLIILNAVFGLLGKFGSDVAEEAFVPSVLAMVFVGPVLCVISLGLLFLSFRKSDWRSWLSLAAVALNCLFYAVAIYNLNTPIGIIDDSDLTGKQRLERYRELVQEMDKRRGY